MMKTIGIEAFLTWAFTRELCKGGADQRGGGMAFSEAWRSITEMAELGVLIDRSPNAFGVIPDISDETPPHPDAVLAGNAVRALAAASFPVPAIPLFPEMHDPHGLIADEVAQVRHELHLRGDEANASHVVALVITSAVLGRGPDTTAEQPKFRMVETSGKPAWFIQRRAKDAFGNIYTFEDDGYDARSGRPRPRAYRKWRLAESMRGAIMGRIEHIWWREALKSVWVDIAARLSDHRLMQNSLFETRFHATTNERQQTEING